METERGHHMYKDLSTDMVVAKSLYCSPSGKGYSRMGSALGPAIFGSPLMFVEGMLGRVPGMRQGTLMQGPKESE